jgi:hypothetical protein
VRELLSFQGAQLLWRILRESVMCSRMDLRELLSFQGAQLLWRILRESVMCSRMDLRGTVVSQWRLRGAAGRQDGGRAVERRDYLHCWGVTVCFSPFSRMTVGGSVCLQGEDESFSSCCSTTRCPAQTPGLRMCACSAVQTSAHPQGVLVMPEEVGPRPACDALITGGVLPVSRY